MPGKKTEFMCRVPVNDGQVFVDLDTMTSTSRLRGRVCRVFRWEKVNLRLPHLGPDGSIAMCEEELRQLLVDCENGER